MIMARLQLLILIIFPFKQGLGKCSLLFITSYTYYNTVGQSCLQPESQPYVEFNDDYDEDGGDNGEDSGEDSGVPSLPGGTQAIVTTYQFHCCGNITSWRAYKLPGNVSVVFQVWRPLSDGCYSLVGWTNCTRGGLLNFQSYEFNDNLVGVDLEPSDVISFQPGDVVGYLTLGVSDNDEAGIQLNNTYDQDIIWYSNEFTSLRPGRQCLHSDDKVLSAFTNAVPVISVGFCKYFSE